MSNTVYLEPTEFKNIRTGDIDKGFRMFDNYGKTYDNTLESVPDDDLELLELVLTSYADEVIGGMVDYLLDNKEDMYIGGTLYTYKQIEKYLKIMAV